MRRIHLIAALIQALLHDVLIPPMGVDAGVVSPPLSKKPVPHRIFHVMSLVAETDDGLQFAPWSAANGSLYVHLPRQGADCDDDFDNHNQATFYLDNSQELHLFSSHRVKKKHRQRFWVDRTGKGQGRIVYMTGHRAEAPPYALTHGWMINERAQLVFRDTDYLACPGYADGSAWKIFLEDVTHDPKQKRGCVRLGARIIEMDKPVSCVYTRLPS